MIKNALKYLFCMVSKIWKRRNRVKMNIHTRVKKKELTGNPRH